MLIFLFLYSINLVLLCFSVTFTSGCELSFCFCFFFLDNFYFLLLDLVKFSERTFVCTLSLCVHDVSLFNPTFILVYA